MVNTKQNKMTNAVKQNLEMSELLQALGIGDSMYVRMKQLEEAAALVEEGKLKPEVYANLKSNMMDEIHRQKENLSGGKHKHKTDLFANLLKGLRLQKDDELPSSQAGEKPILSGYLYELREKKFGRSPWRKRWVELFNRCLIVHKSKGDTKHATTVILTPEFYVQKWSGVQGAPSKAVPDIEDDGESVSTGDQAGRVDGEHAFIVSDIDSKLTFGAKSDEEMMYWIHTLTATIRKIIDEEDYFDTPQFINGPQRNPEQIQKDFEDRKEAYLRSKRQKTLAKQKRQSRSIFGRGKKKMTEADWAAEEAKWEIEADEITRIEMAKKLWEKEREHVRQLEEEQRRREEELEKVREDAHQWKDKAQKNFNKYEEAEHRAQVAIEQEKKLAAELALVQQMRAQNIEKEEALIAEHDLTAEQLKNAEKKRRQSQHPAALAEYEAEVKALKAKLAALQSALEVDLDGLDWDGTLEDAEAKMKLVVPRMMSENQKDSMDAQAEFEQWDKIIRNHADYKKREANKWITWENENKERNNQAYSEMTRIVPKEVITGVSEDFLKKKGLKPNAAKRVMATKILQFLYMDPEKIKKVHVADLSSRYVPQGLDIVELRAVYTRLPDEFENDRDGRKKVWLDQYRMKLFQLTNKEKEGKLTRTEERHHAYRKPEDNKKAAATQAKNKAKGGKKKKPAVAKKLDTSALNNLFAQGGPPGPPGKGKGGGKGGKPSGGGLPIGGGPPPHVLAMMKRGQEQQEEPSGSSAASKPSSSPTATPNKSATTPAATTSSTTATIKTKAKRKSSRVKSMRGEGLFSSFKNMLSGGEPSLREKPIPAEPPKEPESKEKRKKDLKKKKKEMTEKEKLLAESVRGMMDSAKRDYDVSFDESSAPAFDFGVDYGKSRRQTLSKKRAGEFNRGVENGINQLLTVIENKGSLDKAEGGVATITFGELFEEYENISDMLVGLLMRAKKRKLVKYHGDMLFQGIHDAVKITLLVNVK